MDAVPRSIWKGVISFGMVAIPIRLYLATESKSISFRLLCPEHKSPIKNKRWCPAGDHEVVWNDVLRGYEYEKDRFVVLTDEDLGKLPLKTSRAVEIQGFVEDQELPGEIYYQSAYYLEPEKAAAKPYALLRKALLETKRVAIAKVAFRDREHLASLRPHDGVLLMNTLNWPDEIRSYEELDLPSDTDVQPRELAMAKQLIEAMATKFEPEQYEDQYRAALMQIVEAKREGQEIVAVEQAPETTVVDLMTALKASVEAAKSKEKERPAERAKPARKRIAS
jgi:DNA end-binding protein Ku